MATGPEHPVPTAHRGRRYLFYDKHHDPNRSDAAQWLPLSELTREQEFAVFDRADELDLADDDGNLYGLRQRDEGSVPPLGTRGEQVAKFPFTPPGQAWHGFPVWPIEHPRGG